MIGLGRWFSSSGGVLSGSMLIFLGVDLSFLSWKHPLWRLPPLTRWKPGNMGERTQGWSRDDAKNEKKKDEKRGLRFTNLHITFYQLTMRIWFMLWNFMLPQNGILIRNTCPVHGTKGCTFRWIIITHTIDGNGIFTYYYHKDQPFM